jgi:hypothetical protein
MGGRNFCMTELKVFLNYFTLPKKNLTRIETDLGNKQNEPLLFHQTFV